MPSSLRPAIFGFFMSASIFAFTWYSIIRLVYARFQQFMNHDAKKIRAPLKLSLTLYFTIWCGYPMLWILDEFGLIPGIAVHVLSMIMDVAAKSVYGFALLKFQLGVDKQEFNFAELTSLKTGGGDSEMPAMIRPSKQRASRYNDDDSSDAGRRFHNAPTFIPDIHTWNDTIAAPKSDNEIEKTMTQIADLNKQLATLTTNGEAER